MRICYFADASSIHTLRWTRFFAERGHDIHVITFDKPGEGYKELGIKVHFVEGSNKLMFLTLPLRLQWFKKLLNDINPDLVHSHYVTKYGLVPAMLNFHPHVITAWGTEVLKSPEESRIMKWAAEYILSKTDLATCDGDNTTKALKGLGVPAKKIKRIFFGIDTKRMSPKARSAKIRKKYGSPYIISLRHLTPLYDVGTLVRSAPLVLKKHPKAKFLIAGKGPVEEDLKALAKELGVEKNVKFIGSIKPDEMPAMLASADIYVSTSLSDSGLAASTGEAMACGVPIVISNSGDNEKIINESKGGYLIPLRAPKELGAKLNKLLGNAKLRKKLGKKSRDFIKDKQDYYKEMGKMEKLYEGLVK